jgi:formiminoglutamase
MNLSVDTAPLPWTGRNDGADPADARWWQKVEALTALGPTDGPPDHGTPGANREEPRPAAFLGFCSDEGVRRNQGRPGAALGPQALRAAMSSLAVHSQRALRDAGDVVVSGTGLEDGQHRAGQAVTSLLNAGFLTVLLGGGHETAYASYLGVAGSTPVQSGRRLGVLNLDAHFDLRREPVATSGTPFLQMADAEKAAGRDFGYAVLGISAPNNTSSLFRTADRLGVAYLQDEQCSLMEATRFVAAFLDRIDILYLTIDLDVLPASVAPGVSAPAGYGVPLDVIAAVCRQVSGSGKLLHCDVAELNPPFDVDSRTARVAARLVSILLG